MNVHTQIWYGVKHVKYRLVCVFSVELLNTGVEQFHVRLRGYHILYKVSLHTNDIDYTTLHRILCVCDFSVV